MARVRARLSQRRRNICARQEPRHAPSTTRGPVRTPDFELSVALSHMPPAYVSSPVRTRALGSVLPNGSALDGGASQVLEPQQHSEHPFELAVEMDLVAAKPLQLVRVERLTERLLADQRPMG